MQNLNLSIRETNEYIMASISEIDESQFILIRGRLVLDRIIMHPETADATAVIARSESYLAVSDRAWLQHRGHTKDVEEKSFADAVSAGRHFLWDSGLNPLLTARKRHDAQRADNLGNVVMPEMITRLLNLSRALAEYQARTNARHFVKSHALYERQQWLTWGGIAATVLVVLFALKSLLRSILRPVNQAIPLARRALYDGSI
jgi:hypothetical protein